MPSHQGSSYSVGKKKEEGRKKKDKRCRQETANQEETGVQPCGNPSRALQDGRSAASGKCEKPVPGILNNPFQTFFQLRPSHCTASNNRPLMGLDRIQLETLPSVKSRSCMMRAFCLTLRMSSSSMQPVTSVLFENTRRLAPINRYGPYQHPSMATSIQR